MANVRALQEALQKEVEEFKKVQEDINKNHAARQKFLEQKNENDMVKKELGLLEDGACVFRLVGPVLIKQEQDEAKSNVDKRLGFINGELERLEKAFKAFEKKQAEKENAIRAIQQKLQKQQQQAQATTAQA
ncbi:unnamed protein product [Pedinophyceae sp. YPF-701]|nr:unnamed protein product [Pedinophyceae sp. YPF-701]